MRPAAQVDERVAGIDRDLRPFGQGVAVLVHVALFQAGNKLQLVGLVGEQAARLVGRDRLAHESVFAGDDLAHPLLDLGQVFGGQRTRQIEVIIETIFDRRSDGHLRAGKKILHGLGHKVSSRMAQDIQTFGTIQRNPV